MKHNIFAMNKKQYTAPVLTVVEFKAERGYAFSGMEMGLFMTNAEADIQFNTQGQENWSTGGSLFDRWD